MAWFDSEHIPATQASSFDRDAKVAFATSTEWQV